MNENYVFWDVEPVDYWDTMWDSYKSQFDALGPYPGDGDSPHEAMTRFAAMLAPLKDGHLYVTFNFQLGYYTTSPSQKRVLARYAQANPNTDPMYAFFLNNWSGTSSGWNPDGSPHTNYNFWEGAIRGYFADPACYTTVSLVDPDDFFHIATGRKMLGESDYILYLYFSSFFINANSDEPRVLGILQQFMSDLVNEDCKGVIFDLRGNSGGDDTDMALLLAPLLDRDMLIGYDRSKKSSGRLDYLPYMPEMLLSVSENADLKFLGLPGVNARAANAGKIAVTALVNDYSKSCGEFMPIAIRALGGTVVGTQTWGATGPMLGSEYSPDYVNGGSFTIADSAGEIAIGVKEAGYQFRGPNYENYEGVGVTPDYPVDFDYAQFRPPEGAASGTAKDVQLEKALEVTESKIRDGVWPRP
jgi:hypothetical protein